MHQLSSVRADLIRGDSRHAARSPAALKNLPLLLAALFLVAGTPAFAISTPWRVFTESWREKPRTSKSIKSVLPARPLIAASERTAYVLFAEALQRSLDDQIQEALATGDTGTVRKLLADFLTEPRVPAEILLRTGASLAEHDLYAEAAKVFDRAVKDFPQLFEGYYNLALAELALKEYADALATLAKAPPTGPSGEVARSYLRGKIEAALGKNTDAERDLAAAFTAAPTEENYALDLGLFYLRVQNYQRALAVFQKAATLQKNSPFLRLGLGLGQFLGGQEAEAIETCRALLAVQPNFSPARVMMAFALYVQGKIEEAERTAAQGLRDPNPSAYLLYLDAACLIKLQSRDYDLMLKDLTIAARAIPRCSLCYLALSKVHQRNGDRSDATADLEKAIRLDPSLADAWYRLAALYEQAGQAQLARQARRRFEELKGTKANRETEMLRDVFLKSLGEAER